MINFKNADDCVDQIKQSIKRFPNVNLFLKERDFAGWRLKLKSDPDFIDYLTGSGVRFNLLNIVALSAWEIKNHGQIILGTPILENLDKWLGLFPLLISDDSFNHKIRNLEGYNFLASMSELSIAAILKERGYQIGFEQKFVQAGSNKKKDVDISVTDQQNDTTYIEIYMPHHQNDTAGFFNPNDSDHYIKYKVAKKLEDKFGAQGFSGLSGKVLLGINYAGVEDLERNDKLPFFSNNELFIEMSKALPDGVDGLLFFRDDFSSPDLFYFNSILLPG